MEFDICLPSLIEGDHEKYHQILSTLVTFAYAANTTNEKLIKVKLLVDGADSEGGIIIDTRVIFPMCKDVDIVVLRRIFSIEKIDLNFYSNFKNDLLSFE